MFKNGQASKRVINGKKYKIKKNTFLESVKVIGWKNFFAEVLKEIWNKIKN